MRLYPLSCAIKRASCEMKSTACFARVCVFYEFMMTCVCLFLWLSVQWKKMITHQPGAAG